MPVKLLTEQHLELLSLSGGCTGCVYTFQNATLLEITCIDSNESLAISSMSFVKFEIRSRQTCIMTSMRTAILIQTFICSFSLIVLPFDCRRTEYSFRKCSSSYSVTLKRGKIFVTHGFKRNVWNAAQKACVCYLFPTY